MMQLDFILLGTEAGAQLILLMNVQRWCTLSMINERHIIIYSFNN